MKSSDIRKLRVSLGWSQAQLAKYLCVERVQVTRLESAKAKAKCVCLRLLKRLKVCRPNALVEPDKWLRPPVQQTIESLKELRYKIGYPQDEMAQYMGISLNYYNQLENGGRRINKRLCRLLEAFIVK
jgi:transcriptional regulator with XRE-family HTH domain